jgi:serine/threonine protein kinase
MLENVFKCEERQGLPFPYQLGSLLGVGGMGVVYELEYPGCADLAVKFVHPGVAHPQAAQAQLAYEANIEMHLQGLTSAVQTFSYHFSQEGQGYKIMRKIKGRALPKSLNSRLKKKIIDAVTAIHQSGIVHGDLKPSNILLTDADQIVLIDFGLGRLTAHHSMPSNIRHAYTPRYVSPRVLAGALPEIEDDLYSVNRLFEV